MGDILFKEHAVTYSNTSANKIFPPLTERALTFKYLNTYTKEGALRSTLIYLGIVAYFLICDPHTI